jgi:copper transport protein
VLNLRAVRFRSWAYILAAAAALLAGVPTAAVAHAVLEASAPAHGTVLGSAPERLELRFNEPVDPQLSTVVLVQDSRRIPLQPAAAAGRRMLTFKLPSLQTGLYTVDWRVISTVDGHLTRGAFAFGVGNVTVSGGAATAAGPSLPEVVARWTGLVGVFLLLGSTVTYMWLPVPEAAEPVLRRRLFRLAVLATVAVAAGGLFRVLSDAAAIAGGTSLLSIAGAPLLRVLAVSHTGHDLIFRLVGAIFVTALLRPGRAVERDAFIAILGVLIIGPVLVSHGLTEGLGGITLSLLHIVAASIWVGGLVYLGAIYLPAVRTVAPEVVRPAALRFSRLGLISVAVLVATGIAQAYLYVGSPAALTGPAYGRTLLVKLTLIAPLLATAAINRWRIVPRLAALTGLWRSLLVLVRVEIALALTVALVAAAVAISPPAKSAQSAPVAEAKQLVLGGTAKDLAVTLTLSPARQGRNQVEIVATGAGGRPLGDEIRYLLRVQSLSRDLPAMTMRLDAGADGKATGEGLFISNPGWWSIEVTVRRRGKDDFSLILPLLLDPPPPSANDPEALALLRRAEKKVEAARTWREVEHFSPGEGKPTSTEYVFAAPDRLTYQTNIGTEGRQIGLQSYYREAGGKWSRTTRERPPKVAFRFPLATEIASAKLGARAQEDDRTYQIVTYDDPGGKLHFAAWIDPETGFPRRLFMVGEAHYMVATMTGYNAPVTITPPK